MKPYLLIASIFVIISGCARSEKTAAVSKNADVASEQPTQKQDATQTVQTFSISGFSEDGKSRWQVEGESADIFSDTVDMRSIEAKSYGEETSVTLTAEEGTFFRNSKDVELRKNVVVNTDEGTTLKTDRLNWDAAAEKITTDDYVHVERKDISVAGTGAEAIPGAKKVWLNKDVKMLVHPSLPKGDSANEEKNDKPTIITCDGPLEVDYKNNVSYFNKNVIIEDKEGKIFADKAIAYINPTQRKIYKAIVRGNVKIMHKQNVSYCDKAVYLPEKGKVVLVGRPKVIIYSVDKMIEGTEKEKNESL